MSCILGRRDDRVLQLCARQLLQGLYDKGLRRCDSIPNACSSLLADVFSDRRTGALLGSHLLCSFPQCFSWCRPLVISLGFRAADLHTVRAAVQEVLSNDVWEVA